MRLILEVLRQYKKSSNKAVEKNINRSTYGFDLCAHRHSMFYIWWREPLRLQWFTYNHSS